ncbi:MAG TPA: acyl-CoA dehydrogenase family protein [Quisquiliibacterium sp.]|nr:acyl-CoA dehydrogenase family protein [Quisquiliibacterium sp.]
MPADSLFAHEHELFRDSFRRFIDAEIEPHHAAWEAQGVAPREIWRRAGQAGFLLPSAPAEYGGGGGDFLHTTVILEEIARSVVTAVMGFTTHSDIVGRYILNLGTEEQRRAWLPGMASGEAIWSIAMTEPSAGSDLKAIRTVARREGDHYVLSGQKTFITNGWNADFVLVAAKTDPAAGARGISLLRVDTRAPGFSRGKLLDKIGLRGQDTAELFFDEVRVPVADRLGDENRGFHYLTSELAHERIMIAIRCAALVEAALQWTIDYTKQRQAFGKALFDNQALRFRLAEIKAHVAATRALVDRCVGLHLQGRLTSEDAAIAKLWATEATQVLDDLVQMHGGYGMVREYRIARAYTDARPNRIFGGASEVMKEIIARAL